MYVFKVGQHVGRPEDADQKRKAAGYESKCFSHGNRSFVSIQIYKKRAKLIRKKASNCKSRRWFVDVRYQYVKLTDKTANMKEL